MPLSEKKIFMLRWPIFAVFMLFCTCIQTKLWAQYNMPQNDVWTFGLYEGVNFLPGPAPVPIATSSYTQEGCATVSDNAGHLLFHTEGINGAAGARIFDRTGALMPHGAAIVPFQTFSCTQAAAIVPVIGNPDQYYVFSLQQGGSSGWDISAAGCHLYYCIVDMTLNGGFGDVITATLATPLDSGLCEKMTVVAGDNCNIWLLAHEKDAPVFKAYNISASGISTPVVSAATGELPTGLNAYKIGTIKVSPDRTLVTNCVMNGAYLGGSERLELLKFDAVTGIVSGCQVLNNFINQYDAEFSPDNSKLYVHMMGSKVYQYDLSLLPDIAAVISSQFLVYTSPDWGGQMKLGPDGKIYVQTGSSYLDCINSPDLLGSLCNYTYHAIHLAGYVSTQNLGLPNMQIVANLTDTVTTHTDTTVCALAATLHAPSPSSWYSWSTGATTQSVTAITSGIYWVKSAQGCSMRIDTFYVTAILPAFIPSATSASFCAGSSVVLTAPATYITHMWSTGVATSSVNAIAAGTYTVADTNLSTCSLQIDTFHVMAILPAFIPSITPTSFCAGSSVVLTAPAGYVAHVWSTGATTSSVTETAAGTYWVADTIFSTCSLQIDTFHVTATPLALISAATAESFCTGSSVMLTAPVTYTAHVWNTGAITSSVTETAAGTYWVADTNFSTCSLQMDTFHVTATPLALLPATTAASFCMGSSVILTAPAGYTAHIWSTGATTSSITETAAGTYWVADTNLSTCSLQIDTFHVTATPLALVPAATAMSFCIGASIILTAPAGYTAHIWSTGATTSFITETAAGTYWVTDTNLSACSLQTDTFHVTATPLALMPATTAVSFCTGTSIILTAPASYIAHVWNTSATTSSVIETTAGTYWVTDTNLSVCVINIDTFQVTATPLAIMPALTAISFCTGSSVILTAPAGYTAYVWTTGATTSSVTETAAGTYRVVDSNFSTCIIMVDTFHVTAIPLALVPEATAASFCTGSSVSLTAPAGYTAHVWNTGATTPSVTETAAGTYWVADTIFSTCTLQTDTFHVTPTPLALMPAATAMSICTGASVILTAPSGYTAFVWNTGSIASSVTETAGGTYWVTDSNLITCIINIDTFNVAEIQPPLVGLGDDTTVCLGNALTLSSPTSVGSFLWSTGSTASSITAQASGAYYLTVTKQGCSVADTIKISQIAPPSPIILGSDTTLCKGDRFVLSAGYDAVVWNTGVIANSITVTDSGTYSTTVTNACGSSTSHINITFEPCDLDFPNAFTPNNDGRNDVARAIGYLNPFRNYTLSIYNRFGQRVFYTEDIYAGWDGKFNNVPQELDTYFYMITYSLKGKHGMLKGDLTLIR